VNVTSRISLMQDLCAMHNKVNVLLNKTSFDCKKDLYKTYGGDCGCGVEEENTPISKENTTITKENTTITKENTTIITKENP